MQTQQTDNKQDTKHQKEEKNDLPQLDSASCGKSFQRVMVTRYKELW